MLAVELAWGEGERIASPGVMTLQALAAGGEMPRLFSLPAGGLAVLDRKYLIGAGSRHKVGVGLLVVPAVRVTVPFTAVEVQNLGFQTPAALRLAALHLERKRACQNGILGEEESAAEEIAGDRHEAIIELHARRARQGDEALGRGMIGPL